LQPSIKYKVLRVTGSIIIATLATAILASFFSTQRILSKLNNIGGEATLGERFSMTLYDLHHFGTLYGMFIFVALLIAFTVNNLIYNKIKYPRRTSFIVAGVTAIAVMLWLLQKVYFGVPIIGGARDLTGLILQLISGGIGGLIYAHFTKPRTNTETLS